MAEPVLIERLPAFPTRAWQTPFEKAVAGDTDRRRPLHQGRRGGLRGPRGETGPIGLVGSGVLDILVGKPTPSGERPPRLQRS
jgi:hypothetical protein